MSEQLLIKRVEFMWRRKHQQPGYRRKSVPSSARQLVNPGTTPWRDHKIWWHLFILNSGSHVNHRSSFFKSCTKQYKNTLPFLTVEECTTKLKSRDYFLFQNAARDDYWKIFEKSSDIFFLFSSRSVSAVVDGHSSSTKPLNSRVSRDSVYLSCTLFPLLFNDIYKSTVLCTLRTTTLHHSPSFVTRSSYRDLHASLRAESCRTLSLWPEWYIWMGLEEPGVLSCLRTLSHAHKRLSSKLLPTILR